MKSATRRAHSAGSWSGAGIMPPGSSTTCACGRCGSQLLGLGRRERILARRDDQRRRLDQRELLLHAVARDRQVPAAGAVAGLERIDDEAVEQVRVLRVERGAHRPELDEVRPVEPVLDVVHRRLLAVELAMLVVHERRRREDQLVDAVGVGRGDLHRGDGSGVVARERRALDAERVEHADRRLGPQLDRVLRPAGLGGVAEPDRVDRDRVEPLAEDRHDVAELVPRARRLVEQDDRRARAGLRDVDRAGGNGDERAVHGSCHRLLPPRGAPSLRSRTRPRAGP